MSDAKHTKGPWEVVGASKIWKPVSADGGAIAIITRLACRDSSDFHEVFVGDDRWDEAMANARLIAASPEMHSLLHDFVEMDIPCPYRGNDGRLAEWCEWYKKVREVLSKVGGQ